MLTLQTILLMETILLFLKENYQWLFSGAALSVIGLIINIFIKQKRESNHTQQQSITTNINIGTKEEKIYSTAQFIKKDIISLKAQKHIVFIDDMKFEMVQNLKKAGWAHTKRMSDIKDYQHPDIIDADIIFVDINNVGKALSPKEGKGVAVELKRRYPEKIVIIYSAVTEGNRFDEDLRAVDYSMDKNSSTSTFLRLIEDFLTDGKKNRNE